MQVWPPASGDRLGQGEPEGTGGNRERFHGKQNSVSLQQLNCSTISDVVVAKVHLDK